MLKKMYQHFYQVYSGTDPSKNQSEFHEFLAYHQDITAA